MLEADGTPADDPEARTSSSSTTCSFIDAARQRVGRRDPRRVAAGDGQKVVVAAASSSATARSSGRTARGRRVHVLVLWTNHEIIDHHSGSRQLWFRRGQVAIGIELRPQPSGPTTFVKISEGAIACAASADPVDPSGHRSRPAARSIPRSPGSASQGVKEVVLVAQDMSLYGRDSPRSGTASLLRRLATSKDCRGSRMLYQYPRYVNEDLFRCE